MVTGLLWALTAAMGGYTLYILARGRLVLNWVAGFITYFLLIFILLPFIPRSLPPVAPLIPRVNFDASVMGFFAAVFKILYDIFTAGGLDQILSGLAALGLIPPGAVGFVSSSALASIFTWVNLIAEILIAIVQVMYIFLTIYTLAYIGWLYWLPAVIAGAVVAMWDGKSGLLIAYPFIALAIIGGIMAPAIGLIEGFQPSLPSTNTVNMTLFVADHPSTLVITDQGFGYTPTILVTTSPPHVERVIWLWLNVNYTNTTVPAFTFGPFTTVVIKVQPPITPITCPGGACGAYYILYGVPSSITQLNNGTIVITTNQPISIWLWGGGYWVNKSLVALSARVGNETLNATLIGCNYTTKPSLWLKPTDVTYYNGLLAQIPNTTSLPPNYPTGYEEVTINVTPGVARLGNETRQITCVVRLYGVVNNIWNASTFVGYTPVIAGAINTVNSLPNLTNYATRILMTVLILAGVGVGEIVTWDWWFGWVNRMLGNISYTPPGQEEQPQPQQPEQQGQPGQGSTSQ